MLYSVLAVGDVVGEAGLAHLERHLRPLQKLKHISFTVVNGENISGVGLTCKQAWRVYDAGADAVTLGNHTFGKMEICRMLDETPWLLRPANLSGRMPGHGCEIFDLNGLRFRVVNLIGRCTLQWNAENPFTLADRLLEQGSADFTLVDFHAEATSEKLALGYYLDGRVSALWGTHTHVPTADEWVYPNGSCGVVSFGVKGGRAAAEAFMGRLKIAAIETHVADARTCCLHPASSTHRQMNAEELKAAGVPEDLVRYSCGLEDAEDLIADLAQALDA